MSAVADHARPSLAARLTLALARASTPLSRPIAGRRAFPLYAIVQHRGRRTGRTYAVPVAIRVSPTTFTIPLPWGRDAHWMRNVLAADECLIRWRGADHRAAAPRVIGFADAEAAFHPIQRLVLRAAGIRSFLRLERAG